MEVRWAGLAVGGVAVAPLVRTRGGGHKGPFPPFIGTPTGVPEVNDGIPQLQAGAQWRPMPRNTLLASRVP
eukprot:163164-Pyramimonas_sp.AAC.1